MKQPETDNTNLRIKNIDWMYLTDGLMVAGIAGLTSELIPNNPAMVMGMILITMGILNHFTGKKFKLIRKD